MSDNKKNHVSTLPFSIPTEDGYFFNYNEKIRSYTINIPNGELYYIEHFFTEAVAHSLLASFLQNEDNLDWKSTDWRAYEKEKFTTIQFSNIQWRHDQIKLFGKSIYTPRYSAWYGDKGMNYTYSGLTLSPIPWNKDLIFIKKSIQERFNNKYNSVLLNWYRDGNDYMSWHADDEKELGQNPTIASVNLGTTRRFLLRRNSNHAEKIEFQLKNGSLLIMKGKLQHYWQHSVPKQRKIQTNRINLTFRNILKS